MGMKKGSRWQLLEGTPNSEWKWHSYLFGFLRHSGIPMQTKQRGPEHELYVPPRDFEDAKKLKEQAWNAYQKGQAWHDIPKTSGTANEEPKA